MLCYIYQYILNLETNPIIPNMTFYQKRLGAPSLMILTFREIEKWRLSVNIRLFWRTSLT